MVTIFNPSKEILFLTKIRSKREVLVINVSPKIKVKKVVSVIKDFFAKYPKGEVIILSRINYLKSKDVVEENKNIKAIERLAYIFSKKYKINCVRIGDILESKKNILYSKTKEALKQGKVTYSINEHFYYFISKKDISRAIKNIIKSKVSGRIFNITLNKVTEEDIIKKLRQKIYFIPEPLFSEVSSTNDKIINFTNNELISFYPNVTLKKYLDTLIRSLESVSSLAFSPKKPKASLSLLKISSLKRRIKKIKMRVVLHALGTVSALVFLILFLISLDFLGNNYLLYKYFKQKKYDKALIYANKLRNTYLPTEFGSNYNKVYASLYYGLQAYSVLFSDSLSSKELDESSLNNLKEMLSLAINSASEIDSNKLLTKKEKEFYKEVSPFFSKETAQYLDFIDLLPLFKNQGTFIVLIQNSNEIRPTGGFIGSYALLKVKDFKIKEYKFDDIYNIDGYLKENYPEILLETPQSLKEHLNTRYVFARDLGLIIDPSVRNKYAVSYFEKALNEKIDGIVYLNLNIVRELLKVSGPIYLGTYKTEINSDNFDVLAQEFAEKNYYPGSTQKANFLSILGSRYIDSIKEGTLDYLKFLPVFLDLLQKKELLLYFKDSKYQKVVDTLNLEGLRYSSLSKEDYLYILESNLGENKVNKLTKKDVSLKVKYDVRRGLQINDLSITLFNPAKDAVWPYGSYKGLLSIILPKEATLASATLSRKDAKDLNLLRRLYIEPLGTTLFYVQIPFVVPLDSKVTITLSYEQKKDIPKDAYTLIMQKQPGTKPFKLNLSLFIPDRADISKVFDLYKPETLYLTY